MSRISRQAYADMFGPTVGDRVRLADTDLWVEVEKDFTIYGEEVKFGGGKVIRDGMGQGQMLAADAMDLVLTNALIIDHWGIVKADIGVKHGRIARIGKAGNPDVQPGVTVPVGPGTEVIAAEGRPRALMPPPARQVLGTCRACCRPLIRCQSISACWARATPRGPKPCASRSRPVLWASSCTKTGARRLQPSIAA